MSIEQIKKAAKNLQRLLPGFLEKHQHPFALTALQQLVCQLNGYPNMEVATSALKERAEESTDALGRFYNYPWMEIDPQAVMDSVTAQPNTDLKLSVVPVESASDWIRSALKSKRWKMGADVTIIVAAGERGNAFVDAMHDDIDRKPAGGSLMDFGHVSTCTVSQRVGITLNWMQGWDLASTKGVLKEMVRPCCSAKQYEACCKAVDVIVDQVDKDLPEDSREETTAGFMGMEPSRIEIRALSAKLQAFLALSEGGWSKHSDIDFARHFDDEQGEAPSVMMMEYADEDLRRLVGPLESLLCRLGALGNGEGHTSSMGYRADGDNMDFGDFYGGAHLVVVDMETKRLDHVVAMAVLSKLRATLVDKFSSPGFDEGAAEVVLVTR